ncbi:MAG: hypothetical protein Q9198_007704 [Flavoplaca austrocitrina]
MSENNIDIAKAANRWRNARTVVSGSTSPGPKPWSIQKVHIFAGRIWQRLAEYDLWAGELAKEEVEEMARERDVSFATVKKDIRISGQMVDTLLKYLEHSKLWTIVILLLVYIPKQKLDDMNSKTLRDLIPQPKTYHGSRIYQSRDVFEILKTAYYTNPARKSQTHHRRRFINAPEGGSTHQLILPLLTQCQPDQHKFQEKDRSTGHDYEHTLDLALADLHDFAKESNPEGRKYLQEAELLLRNLAQQGNNLPDVLPMFQELRSFIQTSRDQFDDKDRHLASEEILDYIKTIESMSGSLDEQWYTVRRKQRDKLKISVSEKQQVVDSAQPQTDDVTIIGSLIDNATILEKLDWSMHYS